MFYFQTRLFQTKIVVFYRVLYLALDNILLKVIEIYNEYETDTFTHVLSYVQRAPRGCKFSEANDRLRIIYDNLRSINTTYDLLGEIV